MNYLGRLERRMLCYYKGSLWITDHESDYNLRRFSFISKKVAKIKSNEGGSIPSPKETTKHGWSEVGRHKIYRRNPSEFKSYRMQFLSPLYS